MSKGRLFALAGALGALAIVLPSALDAETVEYRYDVLGRLTKACYNTQNKHVSYAYDAAGNRVTVAQAASCPPETPPNSPPNAVDDWLSGQFPVDSGVTVNVRANDSDPDNDPILVTQASCNSSGCVVSIQGGGTSIYVYGSTEGAKQVSYTISDGQGGTDTATATVSMFIYMCGEVFC